MRPISTQLPTRNLDVLRAMAVLFVVADHVTTPFTSHIGTITTWTLGRVGVLLFFVHTSLVLMSSLERQGGGGARAFYVRRAFRIYPLAIVAIAGTIFFRVPHSVISLEHPIVYAPLSRRDLIANLLLMQSLVGAVLPISVLWSLPLEVQMYAVLPACYRVAQRGARAVALLIGASIALWSVALELNQSQLWRLNLMNFVPCFLAGVLAFALLRRENRYLAPAWAWPLILGAVLLLAAQLPMASRFPQAALCLLVGCALPFVRDARENRVTRAAKVLCEYSYGIYLTHVAAVWLAFVVCHAQPLAVQWGTFALSAMGLAVLSHHAIERPSIAMGKRLAAAIGSVERSRPSVQPAEAA